MEGILSIITKVGLPFKPREATAAPIPQNPEKVDIMSQIEELKLKIVVARSRYELETNFDLIESYILELNSLEKRYDFLIKRAKQAGIVAFQI